MGSNDSLKIGSVFSGIGGLELGLEWSGLGRTVWQVERNPFCRRVLRRHWRDARQFADVRLVGRRNLAPVDLVCGGFPCQDVSGAGKGAGLAGSRSGLWFEFARIVRELRPQWVIVENVASGAARWVDQVRDGLGRLGYASLPIPLSAASIGAPHKRERIFVVAWRVPDARGESIGKLEQRQPARRSRRVCDEGARELGDMGEAVGDANRQGSRAVGLWGIEPKSWKEQHTPHGHNAHGHGGAGAWPPAPDDLVGWRKFIANGGPKPAICRGLDGLPCGMARREWGEALQALGNAVVPQCAEVVGWIVREMKGAMLCM